MLISKTNAERKATARRPGMAAVPCPCCSQPVSTPHLDIVIRHYDLTPLQAKILTAVWNGKGMPVSTERILARMYEDDADGGPDDERQYAALKEGMSRARSKLKGSGIEIINAGIQSGWRLVLQPPNSEPAPRRPGRGRQRNAPPRRLDVDDSLALAAIRSGSNPQDVAWRLAGPKAQLRDQSAHYKRLMRKLNEGKMK